MNVIQKKLNEIFPYEKNAKKHDETQIANVAESIRQYGFVQPIVIDKNGVIVIGHCRALAAEKLGMETVPCVCVDDLTAEQVKALRLVDNKTNESPWDFDLLADELNELDFTGFDFDWEIEENNGGISYIDRLMEDGFTRNNEKTEFCVTLVFPIEYEETVKNWIKDNGKEKLNSAVLDAIGR